MLYDVASIRKHFPSLESGAAHFDGPGGSQVPIEVATAVASTMTAGLANRGQITPAERKADQIVRGARAAMADLLGADAGGIAFGRSMTQVTYDVSRAIAKTWREGDEIVVTRLDHDANIRPWVQAAASAGATVRWADFDAETGELDPERITGLLSDRTRLVAATGAANLLGTRPDLRTIADAVHAVGALFYVDGVHLVPHAPVDVTALGADFLACSPYKFGGPHMGVLAASPELLETVQPDKLLPSTNAVPERFELGTLPYELLAGATAAVDFLAAIAPSADRRSSVLQGMAAIETHEDELFERLVTGLAGIPGVARLGRPARRTPTVLFTVAGVAPTDVHRTLAEVGVYAPAGTFYAIECARVLGIAETGAVRAGLGLYTDAQDVDRLLAGVADIAAAA